MRHRLNPNFEAEAEGITTDHIIEQISRDVLVSAEAVGERAMVRASVTQTRFQETMPHGIKSGE